MINIIDSDEQMNSSVKEHFAMSPEFHLVKLEALFDVETEAPEIVEQVNIIEGEKLRTMSEISGYIRKFD